MLGWILDEQLEKLQLMQFNLHLSQVLDDAKFDCASNNIKKTHKMNLVELINRLSGNLKKIMKSGTIALAIILSGCIFFVCLCIFRTLSSIMFRKQGKEQLGKTVVLGRIH